MNRSACCVGAVTWAACAAVLLSAGSCQRAYESPALSLRYEPASGVRLLDESAGPPAVAHFTGGLEIRSVTGALPPLEEKQLDSVLTLALTRAGRTVAGTVAASQAGTMHTGPVARYEIKDGKQRTLVYLVPLGGRFLVITLTADVADYVRTESTFERTLHSLKPLG